MSIEDISDVNVLCEIINKTVMHEHSTNCRSIVVCAPSAFDKFQTPGSVNVKRFHLRDEYYKGNLKNDVLFHWTPSSDDIDSSLDQAEMESVECSKCFGPLPKLVHLHNFNVIQEWFLEVPLSLQNVLESFINTKSLQRATQKREYLSSKIAYQF